MDLTLKTPVSELKTVGKTLNTRLKKLGLETVQDLLWHIPFRYDDFTKIISIANLESEVAATVRGKIIQIASRRGWRSRKMITEALLEDDSGTIRLIWFGQPYITKTIHQGDEVAIAGKPREDKIGLQFTSPQYEKLNKTQTHHTGRLVPIYPTTAGITPKHIRFLISQCLEIKNQIKDWLPEKFKQKYELLSLDQALEQIHFPDSYKSLEMARRRISLEELFPVQFSVLFSKKIQDQFCAESLKFNEKKIKNFVSALPFELTQDQKKVSWKIINDLQETKPMRRLVQGDVGSGKTVVAAIAAYNAIINKKRVLIMAPTEVLARQHYQSFIKLFEKFPIKIALLLGSAKVSEKKKIKQEVLDKNFDIVIGTHSLIQDDVEVPDLSLVIVDEQHRFGVEQRQKLLSRAQDKKSTDKKITHFLSLTATPIPRTFALMLYGDLDISTIKTMPKGRKQIITRLMTLQNREKAYEFMRQKIKQGQQVFVICPLIDESDILGVRSVKKEFEILDTEVFPNLKIAMLHGKLKSQEKKEIMEDFVQAKTDVLVATSVIEVGIDVPNATVMLIEGGNRFGLAQLHQFRGRVGRGDQQSYCFVSTEDASPQSMERLRFFEKINDGFALAEQDLKTRGPGDVYGKEQAGFNHMHVARVTDVESVELAKFVAQTMIEKGKDMSFLKKLHHGQVVIQVHLE